MSDEGFDQVRRWGVLVCVFWCALALTFCHGERATVPSAPSKVAAVPTATGAPAPQAHQQQPVATPAPPARQPQPVATPAEQQQQTALIIGIAETFRVVLTILAAAFAVWVIAKVVPEPWNVLATLFGKNRPCPVPEAALTSLGAIAAAYAAIRPDLKDDNLIVLLIAAIGMAAPLVVGQFQDWKHRVLALVGLIVGLVGVPALGVAIWPFFVKTDKSGASIPTNCLGAIVEELHKVSPTSLFAVGVIVMTFAFKLGWALLQPNTKDP